MSVEAAASAAAKQLGYGALKDLQLEIIKGVATGRDVFAVANWLSMLWLFAHSLTFCIIRQNIPLIVLLLTAIIQDQVSSSIVNLMLMLFFNQH